MEKISRDQPDYAAGLSVLGLLDAGVGRHEDAMNDGLISLAVVQPHKSKASASPRRRITNALIAPCAPPTHSHHKIVLPISTARAPSPIAFRTSLPQRIPPST